MDLTKELDRTERGDEQNEWVYKWTLSSNNFLSLCWPLECMKCDHATESSDIHANIRSTAFEGEALELL